MKIKKIIVEINGKDIELNSEAEIEALKKLLNAMDEKPQPVYVPYPVYPPIYPERLWPYPWYTITCRDTGTVTVASQWDASTGLPQGTLTTTGFISQ